MKYLRSFLLVAIGAICLANTSFASNQTIQEKLAALETSAGGRLGIAALDTGNGMRIQYHADERFHMGCTSKVIGVSAILKKSMTDPSLLQQKVFYKKEDIKGWVVGNKTGTGSNYGITNDIAVIWPPHCAPIVLAIYFTQSKKDAIKREDVVATATRLVINDFKQHDSCLLQPRYHD